jgi:hypothetical protein
MANDSVDYLTTAGSAIAGTPAGGSTRSSHRFPLDLKSDSQGHFMTITAYPSQSRFSNNKDKSPTPISLFIPGGGQNSSLFWQMAHEYDEVKLTRLGTSVIGGIPVIGTATAAAAGAARVAGQGVINPKVDVLYANSDLRSFQFDYFMAPQSKEEQREMHAIIKILRKFSAPEITGTLTSQQQQDIQNFLPGDIGAILSEQFRTGFWFVPPAEFDIKFRHVVDGQVKENPYLPRIAKCVLKRVDVNYSQQNEFSAFKDGSPTQAFLSLVFQEMRVISQADVDNGY